MKDTTFAAVLKKKNKDDNFGYLKIRTIQDRKATYDSLGIKIAVNKWNSRQGKMKENKINLIEAKQINEIIEARLSELRADYKTAKDTNKIFDKKGVFTKVDTPHSISFFDYFNKRLNDLLSRKQIGTFKKQQSVYNHLKKFVSLSNKPDLIITDINKEFVENFENYFTELQLSNNSKKTNVRIFRTVYNDCMKTDECENILVKDPFRNFKNKLEVIKKENLTIDEIDKIDTFNIVRTDILYNVKNYFLFQIYGQGMRVSDLKALRWGNINQEQILFNQVKTKNEHVVFINESLANILLDYLVGFEEKVVKVKGKIYEYDEKLDAVLHFNSLHDYMLYMCVADNGYIYNELLESDDLEDNVILPEKIEENKEYTYKELQLMKEEPLTPETPEEKIGREKREQAKYNDRLELINEYAKMNKDKFIFPLLKDEDFKGIDFSKVGLDVKQYSKSDVATILYNRRLKDLQLRVFGEGFRLNFTSHLARHSYAMMKLDEKIDLYDLSISLGHRSLITTQNYINHSQRGNRIMQANLYNGKKSGN